MCLMNPRMRMKTKIALLLFLLGCSLALNAQISVASFELLDNDITAITYGTEVKDQNGNTCALIKVETLETGFTFDFGLMAPMKVEQQVGEIWVYVPYGVKRVTIHHKVLGTLRDYSFPMSIEKGKTYLMKLTTGKVRIVLDDVATEQWLVFEITPKDAILEVDDKMWSVSAEGTSRNMMPFGTYNYRVQAQNYHPEVGRVEVNDPENNTVVTVTLQPNFGWIEVPADNGLRGAAVYIDNALIGKAPCKSDALKSGQHNVRILKEMYEPYTAAVTVSDNETTRVAPTLTSDFARVTLQVDADAEIWVNDEKKGVRSWTGDLPTGTYRIECKQQGHESTSTQKKVTNSMNGEVITLQAPMPIYGSLNVECTPDLATIYVDGKEMGKAPKLISKILVGEHMLRLSKAGYADHVEKVTITQSNRTQVTATLAADGKAPVAEKPQVTQPETTKPKTPTPAVAKPTTNSTLFVLANAAYSIAPQTSFGLTTGFVRKWGFYVNINLGFDLNYLSYNLARAECNNDGCISEWSVPGHENEDFTSCTYEFTGVKKTSRFSATAGVVLRISDPLYMYVGCGYGHRALYWECDNVVVNYPSSHVSFTDRVMVKNIDHSYQGVALDAGMMLHFDALSLSLGVQTIGVKYFEAKIGIGYNIK